MISEGIACLAKDGTSITVVIVISQETHLSLPRNFLDRIVRNLILGAWTVIWLCAASIPALAQSEQLPLVLRVETPRPDGHGLSAAEEGQLTDHELSGSISGTIVDGTGAAVAGARVRLMGTGTREAQSGNDGQFSFTNIAPGPYQLTITAAGFAQQTSSGILHSGELFIVPQIKLAVATAVTEVQVAPATSEVAEEQIKEQEKQRALGIIPNFYVSYVPNPAPLNPKQKFELAWKTSIDPVTFGLIGVIAGIQQAQNTFSDYGQGAQGYGKRYGASYANFAAGTFIGGAILPSLLKQDPRYFYKGSGTKRSRFLYAIGMSVITKGDNGRWQPNYSNMLGNLAAGGISNLYYPEKDRQGAQLTFENALIGIGATAGANLVEEFVIPKFTPRRARQDHKKTDK